MSSNLRVNTLRPRQHGLHFKDGTFKRIFLNENVWIPIEISLKFVPKGPINNIPTLFQIMAWRRPGDKPLSETMMVSSLTHICVTRPQWVNHWTCLYTYLLFYLFRNDFLAWSDIPSGIKYYTNSSSSPLPLSTPEAIDAMRKFAIAVYKKSSDRPVSNPSRRVILA